MPKPTFRVFLSHRYKSPEVNLQFFRLLTPYANIQFEVDVGTNATNVTRLERSVREADAFVGIYPFPSDDDDRPDLATALEASRYFRLELDLAVRSRRPAIAFVDARYGTAIAVPPTVRQYRYDHREIQGGASPREQERLRDLACAFCQEIAAVRPSKRDRPQSQSSDRVGILLPAGKTYSKCQMAQIDEHLVRKSLTPVHLDCKTAVDGKFLSDVESLDWAIVDIGPDSCASGLPAFLHGYFLPQMRLLRLPPGARKAQSPLETALLAAFEVGYPKDIIRWQDSKSLTRELVQRLTTLYEPRRCIRSSAEARAYFAGASLRKEAVFLSYSGKERDFAARIAQVLRQRFQQVFDYRDRGKSIIPGRPWIDEVFDKLATSAIGVPLLSSGYLESANCKQEARLMMSLANQGKLVMVPVKVEQESLELPLWMGDLQYVRAWEVPSPKQLVEEIVSSYEAIAPRR